MIDQINAWYVLLAAIAGSLVSFAIATREKWAKSKTNAVMEAAQQAGIASMVSALASSQVREKEAWALVSQARKDHDTLMEDIGVLKEDVAELRTKEESCQREMGEFRLRMKQMEIDHREERRRDTIVKANQRALIAKQARQLRDAGFKPDITGIMGDMGPPIDIDRE